MGWRGWSCNFSQDVWHTKLQSLAHVFGKTLVIIELQLKTLIAANMIVLDNFLVNMDACLNIFS